MQSIAVPVTLTVELCPEGADIGALEREVCATLVEAGRLLWAGLLARIEGLLPVPVGCTDCGGYLSANGRAPRRIVTLAAEVSLVRRRHRCRECGAETVPLDDAPGLDPRVQHTLGVRERGLSLVYLVDARPATSPGGARRPSRSVVDAVWAPRFPPGRRAMSPTATLRAGTSSANSAAYFARSRYAA